jgi:hypothetical protein
MDSWGILYMYHSLVVGKIEEFICDNALAGTLYNTMKTFMGIIYVYFKEL